ncbi:MAG: NADH-quinone oxidoreductase subunit F, partial [Proteobacteria bacterium]|nr:NADH-quinone oxidoreductase subunit F [Pseudomonadota bacterium]
MKPLTERIERFGHVSLDNYLEADGYKAARTALAMTPVEVQNLVKDANLRGRGGAGFPTGVKWSFVPIGDKATPGLRYLVCNADEMEPGTFKDRYLIERDPHLLVEGMLIAAYAIQAEVAYVFLRGEYHEPFRALSEA